MKHSVVSRCAMSLCGAAALLSGCSSAQQQGTQALPSVASASNKIATARAHSRGLRPAAVTESVVYSFAGGTTDGQYPVCGLVNLNGMLYGTTTEGGTTNNGTVFTVTPSGAEVVLYNFQGSPTDGTYPFIGLDKSARYGTTKSGGTYGLGTVFKFTASGRYKVLYSFAGGADGAQPVSRLLNVNGTLYGTTQFGGASNNGTVFTITPSGTENVLYSFAGNPDGANPATSLINVNGVLYGTTYAGGTNNDGTVFSITTSGTENVLHSFAGGTADGKNPPLGNLVNVNGGTLYGTTENGGANNVGMVFKLQLPSTYTVLYSFGAYPDAQYPASGLINVGGTLYGTTLYGGTSNEGTVFSVTKSGSENVLYSFLGEPDGANPQVALLNVNGMLYGTTELGGTSNNGTVFAITP